MSNLKRILLILPILIGTSSNAFAETMLRPDDFVGFSFWFISMGSLAATAFFFLERGAVVQGWRTSITVAGIITGITFVHSLYLRNLWLSTGDIPTVYKYIEWLITMPLLAIQFYLILTAIKKVPTTIFWKLLIGALIMVMGGYAGETGYILPFIGFVIWMSGWIFILYEIFSGEAGKIVYKSNNEDLIATFSILRMIVTIGWAVYPLGYVFGYLTGGLDSSSLSIIYNFADFVNKIAFGITIWVLAK